MPKHFSEEEKRLIRDRLISAGLELFEKYGISKTNISDITDLVGISKGSFYAFFSSKGDLFMEVYWVERRKAHVEVFAEISNGEQDLCERLQKYTVGMYNQLKKRPILEIVYDFEALTAISDKSAQERLAQFNAQINQEITDMIQGWMEQDGRYAIEPKIVTKMLRSINFLRFHDYVFGLEDFEIMVAHLSQAVLDYVKRSKID